MKKYLISEDVLLDFIECKARLEALESGGVDNWSWYGESLSDYLNDYFSDADPYDEDPSFGWLAEREIQKYREVEDNAK